MLRLPDSWRGRPSMTVPDQLLVPQRLHFRGQRRGSIRLDRELLRLPNCSSGTSVAAVEPCGGNTSPTVSTAVGDSPKVEGRPYPFPALKESRNEQNLGVLRQ